MSGWLVVYAAITLLTRQCLADREPFYNDTDYLQRHYGDYPRQKYLSDLDAIGPVPNVIKPSLDSTSAGRYVGWAPAGPHMPQTHPQLVEPYTGTLVWYGPAVTDNNTIGPTVQSCNGSSYITFWAGDHVYDRFVGRYYFVCHVLSLPSTAC